MNDTLFRHAIQALRFATNAIENYEDYRRRGIGKPDNFVNSLNAIVVVAGWIKLELKDMEEE